MTSITPLIIIQIILLFIVSPILMRTLIDTFICFVCIFSLKSRLNKATQHVYMLYTFIYIILDIMMAYGLYTYIITPLLKVI